MARSLITCLAAGLLALALEAAAGHVALASGNEQCFSDWSDAAPVVSREGLKSARDVQDLTRSRLGGDVVRITLCRGEQGFVYRLVVRTVDGRISNLTVSAGGVP